MEGELMFIWGLFLRIFNNFLWLSSAKNFLKKLILSDHENIFQHTVWCTLPQTMILDMGTLTRTLVFSL